VSLRGLPERVAAELLFGLQQRIAEGSKTRHDAFRPICDRLRLTQAESLA
jgi:hypothetical protein